MESKITTIKKTITASISLTTPHKSDIKKIKQHIEEPLDHGGKITYKAFVRYPKRLFQAIGFKPHGEVSVKIDNGQGVVTQSRKKF